MRGQEIRGRTYEPEGKVAGAARSRVPEACLYLMPGKKSRKKSEEVESRESKVEEDAFDGGRA